MEVEGISDKGWWEGGEKTLMTLGATGLPMQEADPGWTALIDTCNGFNKLNLLTMMWNVRNFCPEGTRFVFNCYKHWLQVLLHQPGNPPVMLLSW